jgi:hypothetical protein
MDRSDAYHRWKDEAEQGAKAALGKSAAGETEGSAHPATGNLGTQITEIEILKTSWGVSCGEVHSQASNRICGDGCGCGTGDQPIKLVPEEATRQPSRSPVMNKSFMRAESRPTAIVA